MRSIILVVLLAVFGCGSGPASTPASEWRILRIGADTGSAPGLQENCPAALAFAGSSWSCSDSDRLVLFADSTLRHSVAGQFDMMRHGVPIGPPQPE